MFHGCSTDSIGGAGPLQHGDWLVQTVSTVLIGGPYVSAAHTAGVPDVLGQLRTNVGQSVLVTALSSPSPDNRRTDTAMDREFWTRGQTHVANTKKKKSSDRKMDPQGVREPERERER